MFRIDKFIVIARDDWPSEPLLRDILDSLDCTVEFVRSLDELEESVQLLGYDPAYVIIQQKLMMQDPESFAFDDVYRFLGEYNRRIFRRKPGKRVWGILIEPVEPASGEPGYGCFFDSGEVVELRFREPLNKDKFVSMVERFERNVSEMAMESPDFFKDIW